MKNINIKFIPHEKQRYDTLGDYWETDDTIEFRISEELEDDYRFMILIHELIESYLCTRKMIDWNTIDCFDKQYEKDRNACKNKQRYISRITDSSEPGDEPTAPYYWQHQYASSVERLLCVELGRDFHRYEEDCFLILGTVTHPDRSV